jgi:hypothetical protein
MPNGNHGGHHESVTRIAKALCVLVPLVLLLSACNTGFNPGMGAQGARCIYTPDGVGSANFFSYTPDCPGANLNDGFAPTHWILASYKLGCGANGSQDAPVGFLDSSNNYSVHPQSNFQTAWVQPGIVGPGWAVEMHLKPGVTPCNGNKEADWDLQNATSGGVINLHSHHVIAMTSHSGNYQVQYALKFTYNGDQYFLGYNLRPRNPIFSPGGAPGVNWVGCGICDGHHHAIGLDSGYWGTPPIGGGYTNVDIDWTALANYVQGLADGRPGSDAWKAWSHASLNVGAASGVREIFESAGYSTSPSGPAGGVDTFQYDWTMSYPGLQTH